MPEHDRLDQARRAGRLVAQRTARQAEESRRQAEAARRLADEDVSAATRLTDEDRRAAARLAEEQQRDAPDQGGEPEQRDSRRTTPMSFALRAELKDRLNRFRLEGGSINVSGICNDAIERELGRMESGNAVVQRLRVELTERRGPSWTMGYHAGRKWAEEIASWLEITAYATRYTDRDVKVEVVNEDDPDMYVVFRHAFRAPERDYGRDIPSQVGAPSFKYNNEDGETRWEYKTYELEAYWRAWLRAVREVYDENKSNLPSVVDQVPADMPDPDAPQDVDPDDIPF